MIPTRVIAVADGEELVLYEADFAEELVARVATPRDAMTNDASERGERGERRDDRGDRGERRDDSGDARGRRHLAAGAPRSFLSPRVPTPRTSCPSRDVRG